MIHNMEEWKRLHLDFMTPGELQRHVPSNSQLIYMYPHIEQDNVLLQVHQAWVHTQLTDTITDEFVSIIHNYTRQPLICIGISRPIVLVKSFSCMLEAERQELHLFLFVHSVVVLHIILVNPWVGAHSQSRTWRNVLRWYGNTTTFGFYEKKAVVSR
jgi:hypothetical protein